MAAGFPWLVRLGALCGALAVALGAFGAHALRPLLVERGSAAVWQTAVLYHLVHSAVLWMAARHGHRAAALCFAAGVLLFSGSLYVLALKKVSWLGPVTPLGGILLLAGWILLALKPLRPAAQKERAGSLRN